MSVHHSDRLHPLSARLDGEGAFRLLSLGAAALFVAYFAATAAGLARSTSNLIFSVIVLPVPVIAWWAFARSAPPVRRMWLLGAWAATLWFLGSLVWYGFFLANGSVVQTPPGWWDVFFAGAQLLLIAAVASGMLSFALIRIAVLDACVITFAGVALGAAFVGRGLEHHVTTLTLVPLNRPILGIVTLMLLAAAALGNWDGIPRSLVFFGVGEIGLFVGNLVYSYAAVQRDYDNDRWANLGWTAGAELSILAASVVIIGIDRPLLMPVRHRAKGHPAGSHAALLVSLLAVTLTLLIATYGLLDVRRNVALIAIASTIAIVTAMTMRARDTLRSAERSAEMLDAALAQSEETREEVDRANIRLQRTNAELRTLQVAVAQGFNLIDERTQGRLRELVQQAGDDLAALVDENID